MRRCSERDGDLFRLQFDGRESVLALLDRHGSVPLPPYIAHAPEAADERRYQTVYARAPGAVAAPTAGLHFDEPLLERLRAQGVETAFLTLHVGAGTFQPVRVTDLAEHRMHREWYEIPAETAAAVGRARAPRPERDRGGDDRAARARGERAGVGRPAARSPRAAARPISSSPRASGSASSTGWSPTSTCPGRPCSCWSRPSPARTRCARRTGMRSHRATASSATATRCSWIESAG